MKLRFIVVLSCVLLAAGLLFSCEEDIDLNPVLVTEDVIFASGERLRISGRIITNQRIDAVDHGFEVADNPSFNQSQSVFLGERQEPGRFIGEVTGLRIDTRYYVRSFLDLGDEIITGNILEVQTLAPAVFGYSPNFGPVGSVITVTGKNFTSDTEVFFGDVKGEVLSISFESTMQVRVPSVGSNPVVSIRVINQDQELVLDGEFTYILGKYTLVSEFPSNIRVYDGIDLQVGNEFYFGKGSDRGIQLNSRTWNYTVGGDNWQEIDLAEGNFWRAFSSNTYFGGGLSNIGVNEQAVREFYRLVDGVGLKLQDLPFDAVDAVAFEINGMLYLIGGSLGNDIKQYNPQNQSWSDVGTAIFEINSDFLNFTYGNKQYFVNPSDRQLYSYDVTSDRWEPVSLFPGTIGTGGGVAIAIGDKAYIGIGNRTSQMWEFNFLTRTWQRKNDFQGNSTSRTVGVFLWDEKIYFLRSSEVQLQAIRSEFWVFEPDGF